MPEQIAILKLSNGKFIYVDGNSITQEEALESARKFVETWGQVHQHAKAVILYEVEPKTFSECPHYEATKEGLEMGLEIEGYKNA